MIPTGSGLCHLPQRSAEQQCCAELDIKAALAPTGAAILTQERFSSEPQTLQNLAPYNSNTRQIIFVADVALSVFSLRGAAYFWAMDMLTGAAVPGVEIAVDQVTARTDPVCSPLL